MISKINDNIDVKDEVQSKIIEVIDPKPEIPSHIDPNNESDEGNFVRYRRKPVDSPNEQKRKKQMQEIQEELKKQIEEKRLKKEMEKKKIKEDDEKEEQRIQCEKRELAIKYQTEESTYQPPKTVLKKVNKLFEPSDDNFFAVPTISNKPLVNVVPTPKEKPVDPYVIIKEYEKRIKELEVEKDNAIKMAMIYKEKLIKERSRRGNIDPLELELQDKPHVKIHNRCENESKKEGDNSVENDSEN